MTTLGLTVVIPARDAAATLPGAIASIAERAEALLEIVVVDDRSTDATAQVAGAADPRVRVIEGRGVGPAAARNDGVRAARGALVGFLDADDEWLAAAPDLRRRLLVDAADREPERAVVAIGPTIVRREGVDAPPAILRSSGEALLPRTLALAHPFDESLLRGEDLEWFLRLADAGVQLRACDQPVARYHRAAGSLSGNGTDGLLAGLAATIRRRREAAA